MQAIGKKRPLGRSPDIVGTVRISPLLAGCECGRPVLLIRRFRVRVPGGVLTNSPPSSQPSRCKNHRHRGMTQTWEPSRTPRQLRHHYWGRPRSHPERFPLFLVPGIFRTAPAKRRTPPMTQTTIHHPLISPSHSQPERGLSATGLGENAVPHHSLPSVKPKRSPKASKANPSRRVGVPS